MIISHVFIDVVNNTHAILSDIVVVIIENQMIVIFVTSCFENWFIYLILNALAKDRNIKRPKLHFLSEFYIKLFLRKCQK